MISAVLFKVFWTLLVFIVASFFADDLLKGTRWYDTFGSLAGHNVILCVVTLIAAVICKIWGI